MVWIEWNDQTKSFQMKELQNDVKEKPLVENPNRIPVIPSKHTLSRQVQEIQDSSSKIYDLDSGKSRSFLFEYTYEDWKKHSD